MAAFLRAASAAKHDQKIARSAIEPEEIDMFRSSLPALAATLVLSSCPAFAFPAGPMANPPADVVRVICAEGSPNCQKLDQGHIAAGKQVQESLKNNGEIDCQGGGICGNAAAGGAAAHAGGQKGIATTTNTMKMKK
jgi:hypothetical protein